MSTEMTALTDTALADPPFEQQHAWDTGSRLPSWVSLLCRADVWLNLRVLLQTDTLLSSALWLLSLCLQCQNTKLLESI